MANTRTVAGVGARHDRQVGRVAPLARDSGGVRGARSIWGGRACMRQVLYMAALMAVRFTPALRHFYQRLRTQGQAGKVALVAAMRKLLVILNAEMPDQLAAGAAGCSRQLLSRGERGWVRVRSN
ncbi:hypothetical protein XpopCFBP1817_01825 [Xanthomonas populi]|uniref:Transposase IS116/IS110/IS902 C-terminal domain-containing protein n=1 Tax=Xanthomonas populi TaxID=53414 RepID=A0A2S7F4B1_9XANT|nr:hypothetical protein XpopCFBP1817_01825 [Xanthomonas populi]